MEKGAEELDELRRDIKTLRNIIDLALDNGASAHDPIPKACAHVLSQREARLEQLEAMLRNLTPDI